MHPPRVAVIAPVEGDSLCPGSERWESFFSGIRGPRVEIFGLYPIAGLVHERDARRAPRLLSAHGIMRDRAAIEESALRLRTWMYADGPSYDRFVFLAGGPLTPIWTRAVAGIPAARRVKLVPVRNLAAARGSASRSVQGLPGLERSVTRARLLNAIGRGV